MCHREKLPTEAKRTLKNSSNEFIDSVMSTILVGRWNRKRRAEARLREMFAAVTSCGGMDCDDPAGSIMILPPGQRHCIGGGPPDGGEQAVRI
ncbi:MAG: hypothetical protein AAGU75_18500 [Bacillota bacterium]